MLLGEFSETKTHFVEFLLFLHGKEEMGDEWMIFKDT